MPIPGFIATIFYLFGGLVIWTARFLVAYGFTGLYCARPDWPDEIAGIGLLTLVVGLLSLAALGGATAILVHAASRLRSRRGEGSENGRFVHAVAAAVATLGIVAILWESLPLLMMPVCR